jgi:hypothetical protein
LLLGRVVPTSMQLLLVLVLLLRVGSSWCCLRA